MQSSPSPHTGNRASPSLAQQPAVSPSSGSSPHWASASSASPLDADAILAGDAGVGTRVGMPSHTARVSPRASAAHPSQDPQAIDTPHTDDETASSSVPYEEQWASPAEVLEMQAVCREITRRYQADMEDIQAELERTRRERDACRRAAESTAPLQKAYAASKAAYETHKKGEHDWQEERELMRLQLQKLSVDNQKLRLSMEKQRKNASKEAAMIFGSMADVSVGQGRWIGSSGAIADPALGAGTAPQRSQGSRAAGTDVRRRAPWPDTDVTDHARSPAVGAAVTSARATYAAAAVTPGSPSDSKLAVRSNGSGSLFADTPPRVAAGAVCLSSARGSLDTPTPSTSVPSDEEPAGADHSSSDRQPQHTRHKSAAMAVPIVVPSPSAGAHGRRDTPALSPPRPSLAEALVQETTLPPPPSSNASRLSGGSAPAQTSTPSEGKNGHKEDAAHAEGRRQRSRDNTNTNNGGDDTHRQKKDAVDPIPGADRHEPLSASTLPTPSSSNENVDRRSASTNPIYALGVSSSASTTNMSALPNGEISAALGEDGARGPRTLPVGVFGLDHATMAAMHAQKLRGHSFGSVVDGNGAGSVIASTATSSSSGLSLLYRLPRGPAEALDEHVRLVETVNQLTQRNAELEARTEHIEAMWRLSAAQRDQRLLAATHEKEGALREAQHWSDASASLETRVASLAAQLEDSRAAFEDTQQELLETRESLQTLKATHALEKESLYQEMHEAHTEALHTLKETYEEAARATATAHAAVVAELEHARQDMDAKYEALATALEETHAALGKATQELRTQAEAQTAHARATEAAQSRAEDQRHAVEVSLAKAVHERAELQARVEELESHIEHLTAMHRTREACFTTMEARLEEACQSLAASRSAEEALALWQTRATAAEAELNTQRAFYERELRVQQTAMEAMQSTHQQESLKLAKKLEAACIRYDALKMKFATAAHDKGWLQDVTSDANKLDGRDKGKRSSKKTKLPNRGAASGTANVAAEDGGGIQDESAAAEEALSERTTQRHESAPPPPRPLPCDPVKLLQSSNATAAQLCRSLHRPLS